MKNEKSKTTRKQAVSGRAAAYVRVSTTDQGERYSPASQLKALHEKAQRAGRTIPDEWIFSDAHSGKLSSRPAFDKLKALVRTGAPDCVYVYDVSRFARKAMDALWLAAEFKRHGVGLDFVEMPYEDTPTGRLTFTQMCAVAEFLGEKIIEDSSRGCIEKLKSGRLDHGTAPDGYVITKESKLAVNPERAKIWKDIFRWRASEHMAKYAICHRLNRAGIPSARGGQWAPRVIGQNLKNRTYAGEHIRRGIIVPCPAIIDRQTFDEAQKWNEEARAKQVGRPANRYLLTGFLWCAQCGKRYRTNPQSVGGGRTRPRAAYKCGNVDYHPYKQLCHAPQILASIIEPAAWSEIWGTLTNPELLTRLAEDYVESTKKPESNELATLKRQHAKISAQITEAQRMIHGLLISFEAGAKMILADKERLAEIERHLAAAGSNVLSLPTRQQIETFCREFAEGPEPGANTDDPCQAYDERRPILEGIRNLKMRYYDRDLEICGEIPLRSAQSRGEGVCQNSDREVGSYPNSGVCIPFIRKVRVA